MRTDGGRADGTIDFTGYSTAQLQDLECTIDRRSRPLDLAHLQAELEHRNSPAALHENGQNIWPIEFTRESGLRGWLRAKSKRLRLYGRGSLEIAPTEVILRGWQRTWLGVPNQVDLPIPIDKIRNVAQGEQSIQFEARHGYRRRRYAFELESAENAARAASMLPASRTPGFDQEWHELRKFNHCLSTEGAPRVTQILVAVNCVVFLAMAITARRISGFGLKEFERWGANFGPLTVGGQWWRLLSANFLHLNPVHLLVNMWAFWNVGRLAERLFGRWTFLTLYLSAAVLASLSSIAWNPGLISVGASGAIFGIFGAFLAYLARRQTRVPSSVVRAHWLSTLVFVLFSLISGALQIGIDNAAHVGGLLAGFCLGWFLARPIVAPRGLLSLRQILSASAVVLTLALAGLWEVGGIGQRLTVPQQYFESRLWYVDGESRDLALWQRLIAENQSGLLSNDYVGQQFNRHIVPFWRSAYERLNDERLPRSQRTFGALVLDFVRLRLAWARAIVAAASNDNSENEQNATDLSNQTYLAFARIMRVSLLDTARHQPPGLVNSPLMDGLRQFVLAYRWHCTEPPASWVAPVGPHDLRTDLPVVSDQLACSAQRNFEYRNFAALENMLSVRRPIDDLPAGGSTYAAAVVGLDNLFEFGHMPVPEVLRLTAKWRRAYPRSPLPDLVEAMAFEAWAWTARGSGYANSVSAIGWLWFNARVEMAATSLRQARASARSTPLWYQLALEVGIDQSQKLPALRAIFAKGAARFPDYWPLYRQLLRALMPRWGGSYGKVDRFINAEFASTAPRTGFEMYTRLYWMYAILAGDTVDIFTDGRADWGAMSIGFKQLVARYPHSDYVLNAYSNFACRAGDKPDYTAMRPQVMARFSASAWSGKFTLVKCDQRFDLPSNGGEQAPRQISRTLHRAVGRKPASD